MSLTLRLSTLFMSMAIVGTLASPMTSTNAVAAQSSYKPATPSNRLFEELEPEYADYIFEMMEGSVQRIVSDQVNVRATPHMKAQSIDTLNIGQQVTLISKSPHILKLGQRSAHWYKVRYHKDGKDHTGYVWGANFSIGYRYWDGHGFLLGVAPSNDSSSTIMMVNVIKGQQLKQSITFTVSPESLSSAQFRWTNNKGLDGVRSILIAAVSGEACGVPTTTQYMLWNGDKLISLPVLTSVSDAGAFYHTEDYIFPNDKNGKKGQIIKTLEVAEDKTEQGNGKMTITQQERTIYLWKNGRLVKQ